MMQAMAGTAKRSTTSALSKTFAIALLLIPPALRHDPRRKGGQGLEGAAHHQRGQRDSCLQRRVRVTAPMADFTAQPGNRLPSALPDEPDRLLIELRRQRDQLERFLRRNQPRQRRLSGLAVTASTLAAVLTAAPALGGQSFTSDLTKLLGLQAPSWQWICGAAALLSALASASSQMLQSSRLEEKVSRCQTARARLDALELGLELGQFNRNYAAETLLASVEATAALDPTLAFSTRLGQPSR